MSTTLFAGDYASLFAELAEVSSDPVGSYTIDLTSAAITNTGTVGWSVSLAAGSSLTVVGVAAGSTISEPEHAISSQAVYAGHVTFSNITFSDCTTSGGAGSNGGKATRGDYGGASGGGAALGGALYVGAQASVTLDAVSFSGNTANGGNGGLRSAGVVYASGGGVGTASHKAGYAGRSGVAGGVGGSSSTGQFGGAGGLAGSGGLGGNYVKAGKLPPVAEPGYAGGAGGYGVYSSSSSGTVGFGGGGGGGGSGGWGGGAAYPGGTGPLKAGGVGGNGGGGGLGSYFGGGGGGGGTGGISGQGSNSVSYGRGGGGATSYDTFGGGKGGAAYTYVNNGKTYVASGGGGGGLGAGGAVFVRQGGQLVIVSGSISSNNFANGGRANDFSIPFHTNPSPATDGSGFGGGIFIQGNTTVTLDPGAGQTVAIAGVIADEEGAAPGSGFDKAGSVLVAGLGTVSLTGTNTFVGGVTIDGGTLSADQGSVGGTGVAFAGGGLLLVPNDLVFDHIIKGLGGGGGIEFANVPFSTIASGTVTADGPALSLLTVTGSGKTATAVLNGVAPGTPVRLRIDPVTLGTVATIACFAAGTRVLTQGGEVAVERLRVGDLLPVLVGRRLARVRWIGWRDARDVRVVRIAAGAFGPGVPARDLVVSPDHALWLEGGLVPARALAGRPGIGFERRAQVRYYHVETDVHDVIVAEGMAAETYLDIGNRAAFVAGAPAGVALFAAARREAGACALWGGDWRAGIAARASG